MLPGYLADALSLVGIPWPNLDEDELRHSASDLNEFASSLTESVKDTSGVVSDTAGQTDAAFARTFAAQWEGRPREIAVISEGCHVLAGALGVIAGAVEVAKDAVIAALGALAGALTAELFFTGGLGDLIAGGVEVEIAERAINAALGLLEQQVAGQLISAAIHPLTDRIPATVTKFLAGSAGSVSPAVALKADYTQLEMAATRLETHAHRTETTGETLRRRSSGRDFAHGGSPIGAMVKQALKTVLKDLAEQIPKVVAQVQRDMGLFLKKAAKDLTEADKKLASDTQDLAAKIKSTTGKAHSGARIRPRNRLDMEIQDRWAKEAYEDFRKNDHDINRIAQHLSDTLRPGGKRGFSRDEIAEIKDHLFRKEHPIEDYEGGVTRKRFDPSADIADAWIRLRSGKSLPEDRLLLEHELAEARHMKVNPNSTYQQAHREANKTYNWEKSQPFVRQDIDAEW